MLIYIKFVFVLKLGGLQGDFFYIFSSVTKKYNNVFSDIKPYIIKIIIIIDVKHTFAV